MTYINHDLNEPGISELWCCNCKKNSCSYHSQHWIGEYNVISYEKCEICGRVYEYEWEHEPPKNIEEKQDKIEDKSGIDIFPLVFILLVALTWIITLFHT